ncbi:alpha/beta hydrolase [Roseomonas hellenica]|uniref:Alpha/beta hydrolase n=1 Tax=Plastoroseomonas hellenica TaxID=2687306 RepID=A0ABS5F5W8_9PROT|nr:alpha/beta hydrolase [Plastoroseomonas hellenica]MBR0667953.1 alpha/beta hydrolase [Plastoroseomonas hellenica]
MAISGPSGTVKLRHVDTRDLRIAYEEAGHPDGRTVVLVHGWPDDVRCWDGVVPGLAADGCRLLLPFLRGCGETRFHAAATLRSGAIAALGQDLADFLAALDLRDAIIAGHDWGARAGYVVGALFPERLSGLVAMSAGYATAHPVKHMSYDLAKAYWYEWLVATGQGREAMEQDRRRLCRFLWESWSPDWWFSEAAFETTAASWDNPDWAPISIHAYRQRWRDVPGAPEHAALEARLAEDPPITVPTLMLHGAKDRDNFPATSAGKERFFTRDYERRVIEGVGHFLPREAPDVVVDAIRCMLRRTAQR